MTIRAVLSLFCLPALLLGALVAEGATLQVGVGKPFSTIAAAVGTGKTGDTIEIDAGTYPNETMRIALDNLTLRGVGGRAHLKWGDGNYLTNAAMIGNGKAILIVAGNNVTIENLEFSGARVTGRNGAGIRYEGGNLTIRGAYFHDNENGILGEGGLTDTLTIEHSIFERNGYCPTDCAHNVYIGKMGRLVFRFNKSVNSHEGHTLKSRARVSEVIANYFSTQGSDGSYEADFPNGGTVYFIGNIVEQGVDSGNWTLLAYGEEGASNPELALHVVGNTFSNLQGSGVFISASGSPALTVKNNLFSGGGSVGIAADASNKQVAPAAFVNAATADYRLAAGAAAIDAGVDPGFANGYSLAPQWEYVEPAGSTRRIMSGTAWDIGAHEYKSATRRVTVTRAGSGTGSVTSLPTAIDCGTVCSADVPGGADVVLSAAAASGHTFTGWLGSCTGMGACTLAADSGDASAAATFAAAPPGPRLLDIDRDGRYDALTDGLLALRFLFGITGPDLVRDATSGAATRSSAAGVAGYLADIRPMLDIDGDGRADALSDGILILRYLSGLRGAGLAGDGIVSPGAARASPAAIEAQLQALMPPP